MQLADFYFHDPRVDLIPIEHLKPAGIDPQFACLLRARGWNDESLELFDRAFDLYWRRCSALAERSRTWPAPRLRHVAVIRDPMTVRPYAQLLNTSCWSLYACDFDPRSTTVELTAYLFAHGDRMAVTEEVTQCTLHNAAYWFERNDSELAQLALGADLSTRPDAAGFRALAAALPWLRSLFHETLKPPPPGMSCRLIAGSRVLVPKQHDHAPAALTAMWTEVATAAVRTFHQHWRQPPLTALNQLLDWLAGERPPLLVTGRGERILWDGQHAERIGALRSELRAATAAGVNDIYQDLRLAAHKTALFHAALSEPNALPRPHADTLQSGYTYLHRERAMLAYNLHDPAFERLRAPALPYARAMLAARTIHEWCHLAVDAGWVPQRVDVSTATALAGAVAEQFDAALNAAAEEIRRRSQDDLALLQQAQGEAASPGAALTRMLMARLSDYQGNLLACRFLTLVERETYVRHNIRSLRAEYRPAQLWRLLARYLIEYQYLRFSRIPDPHHFFFRSTWFEQDFLLPRVIDEARFDGLDRTVRALCESYAVDESKLVTATR